jgi:hypothetical protein
MEDDEGNELNIHRVDTHIPLQSDQKKPPIDELPAPHVEEIRDEKGDVVSQMPQVHSIIGFHGLHIGNQTATYRQPCHDDNKKRKSQRDPPEGQPIVPGVLPHHQDKQERQGEERKKRIDAIRAKVKQLTGVRNLGPDCGGEAPILVKNKGKGRNQEDADRQKRGSQTLRFFHDTSKKTHP